MTAHRAAPSENSRQSDGRAREIVVVESFSGGDKHGESLAVGDSDAPSKAHEVWERPATAAIHPIPSHRSDTHSASAASPRFLRSSTFRGVLTPSHQTPYHSVSSRRIELRTEDKQEYEEVKKLAAKGASSQSGANETVLGSLRKQAESRSARIGLTDD